MQGEGERPNGLRVGLDHHHHHHHHHHQDDCEGLKAGGHTPSLINFTSILAMVFMLVFTLTSRWRRESRVR